VRVESETLTALRLARQKKSPKSGALSAKLGRERLRIFNAANYFFALGAFGAFGALGGFGAGLPQSERAAAEIIAPASCLVMYPALRQALTALVMAETYWP
jgi:hypothetical protein